MDFPFRSVLKKEHKSYAANINPPGDKLLDCSLGVNPYGYPKDIEKSIATFNWKKLINYPSSKILHNALRIYWEEIANFEEEEIILFDGSIQNLYSLNNIFSMSRKDEVIGFVPSFTDMVESVRSFEMKYCSIPLLNEKGLLNTEKLLESIGPRTSFVYIDRPNNPSGITINLKSLDKILKKAWVFNAYVVVDEAYGGFIPRDESALSLWENFDNLIVVRTFSKGFGLANLRCGYQIAPKEVTNILRKVTNPYMVSDFGRKICAEALDFPNFPLEHCSDFADVKKEIRRMCKLNLTMLPTDDRVPICTLKLNEAGDLQAMLLDQGVLAVSGRDFESLTERFVRIRIPRKEEKNQLLKAINTLDNI